MDINVRVAVRCRPMSLKETNRGCKQIIQVQNKTIHVEALDNQHPEKDFTFDHCYFMDCTQQQVYDDLGKPLITQAMDGFNGTIFAYGQTGSGKSHSMMGTENDKGIIPRINEDLWVHLDQKLQALKNVEDGSKTKYMVTVSFLEIYNENLKDLLNPSEKNALKIRESPEAGIYVEGLCELIVRDANEIMKLIDQGNTVRRVAATNMNEQSSRSHSCFTLKIERKTSTELENGATKEQLVKAKLNLVDLAGSERASKTGAVGSTLKEGANINKSLMALGNVINALSEGKSKGTHIPYRDSKLTRLLQESLGGNSATVMVAAISPADYNYDETISTLKYANRAKSIANAVTRNEDISEKMIRDLKEQIEALKQQLAHGGGGGEMVSIPDPAIEEKLHQMEDEQRHSWEEKERLSKALEEERQNNIHAVVSSMMEGVKEQKVTHMKNIKRLTNEKTAITKQFKDDKDANADLKKTLDNNMKVYQSMQGIYDHIMDEFQNNEALLHDESEAAAMTANAEKVAAEMSALLTIIEKDRADWVGRRENLKKLKERLTEIEDLMVDERAELVATAGLLDQNDKLRSQIQEEERAKAKEMIDEELTAAREKLQNERSNVRSEIESELHVEMDELRKKLQLVELQVVDEKNKNQEVSLQLNQSRQYVEKLESRLADAEVSEEHLNREVTRLTQDLKTAKDTEDKLLAIQHQLELEKERLQAMRNQATTRDEEKLTRALESHTKKFEEEKFQMFARLMDGFEEEKKILRQQFIESQNLLMNAGKDVIYLTERNEELKRTLSQALQWER